MVKSKADLVINKEHRVISKEDKDKIKKAIEDCMEKNSIVGKLIVRFIDYCPPIDSGSDRIKQESFSNENEMKKLFALRNENSGSTCHYNYETGDMHCVRT